MSTFAAPLHFVTTFLVAVGAFACVWLAVSRPEFAPRSWARFVFGAGWALLGVADTLHGAQLVIGDSDVKVLALRTVAYFLLLISLLVPVSPLYVGHSSARRRREAPRRRAHEPDADGPGETEAQRPANELGTWTPPDGKKGRFWSASAVTVSRTAGPAVLALGAALFALRSRIEGARRLALALGLLGASEVFLTRAGSTPTTFDAIWVAGHALHLLGGLALGFWLWRAFRISIQARIVAALVLLLILVIALISATVTNAFARNVRQSAFKSAGDQAVFETSRFSEFGTGLQSVATVAAGIEVIRTAVIAQNRDILNFYAKYIQQPPGFPPSADLVAFLTPDPNCAGKLGCGGTIVGLSAAGTQPGQVNLDDSNLEEINLAGSAEVRSALQNKAATSVDDLGATRSKLVVIGAAPVLDAHSQVVGAVVVGRIINTSFLKGLALPGAVPVTVIGSHGELLGSTLPGADDIVRSLGGRIVASVVQQGTILQAEATAAKTPYYVAVAPIAPEGHRRLGAVMVSQPQTLADTQRNISQTLFLGALAATLVAVGAAAVSGSRITRPIRELTSAAGRVRQGDLSARVPVTEADEVGALSEAFNQMTTSLDTQAADLREAALQESRLRGELETILQSMTDGLIAVDREGRIVTINREAERISGVSAERARDLQVEEVLEVVDSSGSPVDLPVYRMAGGSAAGFITAVGGNGHGIPVAVTSAPITDNKGNVTGAVAVLRDLTSELEVETMKTEFLSNISHELRTPLTPIKGYADLLRRKVVPRAKSISFLNVIVASTERMERIVDMLVDFSAMQAGRLVVRTAPFNLDRATADLVGKWEESAPKHSFERLGFKDLPLVAGDPRLLPRAIDELLDNAVKFSPDGGPITIRGEIDAARSDRVRVSVTDHGIGITSEQMSQIFQDFVQVDASETRSFGGLGLGLAYVRRIIEAHDGELQVESSAGEGSRFSLLIPLQRSGDGGGVRPIHTDPSPVPVVPLRRGGFPSRRPPAEWPGGR